MTGLMVDLSDWPDCVYGDEVRGMCGLHGLVAV